MELDPKETTYYLIFVVFCFVVMMWIMYQLGDLHF